MKRCIVCGREIDKSKEPYRVTCSKKCSREYHYISLERRKKFKGKNAIVKS